MERSKPSTEWNKKERLEVIATISMELIEVSRRGRAVPADAVFDRAQRIQLVATQPAFFLEHNREQILNGFPSTAAI